MKIAILSDIHGNHTSLMAVLKHAESLRVDLFFILGDLVGYYLEPDKVIQEIKKIRNSVVIQGNHERLLSEVQKGIIDIKDLNHTFGEGHQIALQTLTSEELLWLERLPTEKNEMKDGLSLKLCHGAPQDSDLYLYPDTEREVLERNCIEGFDFIFVGHSHYPFVFTHNNCTLINVGSVGMSKDVGGLASWGIIDTSNRVYTPCRTPYSFEVVSRKIIETKNTNDKYLLSLNKKNRYD